MIEADEVVHRDRVLVPARPVSGGPHEHRRGILEGLAIAMALLIVALGGGFIGPRGTGPVASASPSTTSSAAAVAISTPSITVAPSAIPSVRPTFTPTAVIGVTVDPFLSALIDNSEYFIGPAAGRYILGTDGIDPTLPVPFAYDPETRTPHYLPTEGASYFPLLSSGSIVVGSFVRPQTETTPQMTGLAIDDIDAGTTRIVWPKAGYDTFDLFGIAEGYAFGEMVKLDRGLEGQSRAIVIDLATGRLRDLTPAGIVEPALAQVHGIANGVALVALLPGSEAGNRPISRLELVDLTTGATSTPDLPIDRLSGVNESGDLGQLRLDDGYILGQMGTPTGPFDFFTYRISTFTLDVLPRLDSMHATECPARVDTSRLVCVQDPSTDGPTGRVFLYDIARKVATDVPAPGLARALFAQAAGPGQVLIQDSIGQTDAPVVYDAASHLAYRLDLGGQIAPSSTIDVVGSLIVDPQTARVWRLP